MTKPVLNLRAPPTGRLFVPEKKTVRIVRKSERLMVLTAPQRYGAYYTLALDASVFLSVAVKSIGQERASFVRICHRSKTTTGLRCSRLYACIKFRR